MTKLRMFLFGVLLAISPCVARGISPEDRARVRKQLEEYCGLDTEAMIRIVAVLEALELPAEEHGKKKRKR